MLTVLIDYESGNLHSAAKAFQRMAAETGAGEVIVTSDPEVVAGVDASMVRATLARFRGETGPEGSADT